MGLYVRLVGEFHFKVILLLGRGDPGERWRARARDIGNKRVWRGGGGKRGRGRDNCWAQMKGEKCAIEERE